MIHFNAGASLRKTAAALCLVTASFGATQAVAEPELTIKAAHAASATNTGHLALEFIDEQMRERTEGRIGLEIFPNGQLGGERELIESLQLGNLDMAFVSSAPLGSFNKEYFALDIPFLFKDRESVYRVLDGEVGQGLLDSLERVGLHGVGYWENGFRQLTNNVKPIYTPADLEGMKMRTMENEVHIAAWREEGANPAPLAFSELFTALQQGTFDAQEGPINLFYDMKFFEVQKYITKTNHIYSPFVVLMNPEVTARMSDEDRAIFEEVFAESKAYQRKLAQEADDKAEAAMPEITFVELTAEQQAEFAGRMGPVIEMVKKKVGAEAVDRIMAIANGE
ncbi:MAG: C4-dicarboxylate ABC transporter substrate-binding protein [Confluentimicrobium sp.]|jgi:tripartite ATP-independent transporter DctP family solute receptor|uniref:Tripartite ATP-independent transporter DctP family solute receptor n=1 Tax=Celeribacter persicus TaxID=1651082 RepID=A0A2T5GWQ0_9RHOB|nr:MULTISPECIES: TRAP transporter substrate-binding protein [Roseobacteraceae]MBC58880.1 C4-dicarboxylate ABC transporter substrate-binding protein [Actibacterium sp.]MDY6858970.1 TRAP transporter substrate-binding protein [Pseudomonadota bacterium]PTQ63745.1 tripartite ATP-independent transporter DctP family solute receptor [Celeribacter persicus]|tara:strand:- start:888 stop:1901 length:1014 start_codon:yes stop_codon:yes gene_type:complete